MTYFYVIMPVGADKRFAEKKAVIQKIAQEAGLTPYFPFDRTGNISFNIDSTLSILRDSEFVLADLSLERPSCYFELGLAQAVDKDVYLIAEAGTDIHQAHRRNLTRFYSDFEDYERVVSEVLKEAKTNAQALTNV
jgi:nucleoside 2-deoxyribosyltransferase